MIKVCTTNCWHEESSEECIGYAINRYIALRIIKRHIRKNKIPKLNKDDLYNLNNINQTQGYEEGIEFTLETVEVEC